MPFSQEVSVDKGGHVLNKSAYFIGKGMTRSFWLVNGEEITTSFSCEGGIVFSMDELYYNKMSEEFVETLEDVVVYRISLDKLRRLFETNIELANWGRIIHQDEYRRLHRSHKERLTLSAKERYEEFRQQFPQVNQQSSTWVYCIVFGYNTLDAQSSQGSPKMIFQRIF